MYNCTISRVAPNIVLTPEELLSLGLPALTGKTAQRIAVHLKSILAANEVNENKVAEADLEPLSLQ